MSKYLKLFENHTQYETFIGDGGNPPFVKPNVSYCVQENEVHYNPFSWADEYLTFVALEDGTFTFTPSGGNVISYSIDNGDSWTEENSVELTQGNKVLWRGEMTPVDYSGVGKFSSTGQFEAQGNVMSLLFGNDFKGKTDLTGKSYAFYSLFNSNSKLVSTQNLSLPAETLADYCYCDMFSGCTGLTTALTLPATTLASNCYVDMFSGCTGLTTAPVLPATILADSCYAYMFGGCTNLVNAPELPATTLASGCYDNMFEGCTSLTTAPELPVTTLASSCYRQMFNGCKSLTKAPELPATTLATNCYRQMFNGCPSLVKAPSVLPATTLATICYQNLFGGCPKLVNASKLPATTLASSCYNQMFSGCSSLKHIKCLARDISASNCLSNWVSGVASTGTFVKNASMTSWRPGIHGIPDGWTVQDATE